MRAITMPAGIITIIAKTAPAALEPSRPDGKNHAPTARTTWNCT
jgi:hypothetical protein